MSLTGAYAALLAGVIVWALTVRQLATRPWETRGSDVDAGAGDFGSLAPQRIGLWTFLAVITSLFGLFISAYFMRMGHSHDLQHGTSDWQRVPLPPVLWFNSALLLSASIALQWSRRAARQSRRDTATTGLIAGGVLTLAFLGGQLLAWRQLGAAGYFLDNPALAFFYLLTGVHGLHLVGGLVVWARTVMRLARPDIEFAKLRLSIELCTLYWHYLLLVWLVLFGLLLSTSH